VLWQEPDSESTHRRVASIRDEKGGASSVCEMTRFAIRESHGHQITVRRWAWRTTRSHPFENRASPMIKRLQ
jgi:hypothetical protein